MAMTPREWTASALSVEMGLDRRTLSKRLASVTPIREQGRARFYRLRDVVRAVYLLDAASGTLEAERTRLTKAQATRAELEVDVLRGKLIPSGLVEEVWGGMLSAFRARTLAIPTKAAHAVLNIAEPEQAQRVLRAHVHEALSELAAYDASQYRSRSGGAG